MATMVLIAGAMHGAWIWNRVTPLLEERGHRVIALDLPGMGTNRTVAKADVTLRLWGDFVAAQVLQIGRPVVLAAHSRGGLVIGEAAERVAEHVQGLLYITALIVPPGQTGMTAGKWPEDSTSPLERSADTVTLAPELAAALFYSACTPEDASWAIAQLEPEPAAPIATPSGVSWERWGRLPRAYIECTRDQTITLDRQRLLQAAAPCNPVMQLDTDHSPFLSAPAELADAMLQITELWSC